jgi:hypothetical protein
MHGRAASPAGTLIVVAVWCVPNSADYCAVVSLGSI